MSITTNPANIYVIGLGSANITYANGASSASAYAVTAGSVEPFADQEKVTVNGVIKTYLSKNPGTRYNFTAYIVYDGTPPNAGLVPPPINSRIDFDFHESGTDINGIVTSSKIDILDGVAVLNVTMEVVSGLTFT